VVHNKEKEQEFGYGSGSPDHEAVDTKEDQTKHFHDGIIYY